MEQITDPLKQYQQIFHNFFEKVKPLLDRKQVTQFEDLFESHKSEIVSERKKIGLSANKHYVIFYKLLKLQNLKVSELCLYHIEKLVQFKFLTGNCPDYITNAGDNINFHIDQVKKISQQEFRNKLLQQPQNVHYRKLYYCIIESICDCTLLKDDNINLKVIQCLQHLMTCSSCEIHGEPVSQVIKTIINIHSQNKSQILHNLSSNALLQIIHVMFMRMEQVTKLNEEERKTFRNKKSDPSNLVGPAGPLPANNLALENNNSFNSLFQVGQQQQKNIQQQFENQAQQQQNSQQTSTILFNYYVKKVLVQCVDDVCLHSEKTDLIQKQADEMKDKSESEKQEFIDKQMDLIPLRSAPLLEDAKKPEYQNYRIVDIYNEQDIKSGKFGWCFICRNTANNYCKDTRVPICSEACKMTHLEELDKLSKISEETQGYFLDSLRTFQDLTEISISEGQNLTVQELKKKILVLETLLSMLESAGPVFLSKKEFVSVMQNSLVTSLLQNCLSGEKSIMMLSFSLIVSLIQNFRENLKSEIAVFVKDVFLRLLQSNNSDFNHRKYTMEVFHKIFKVPRAILELYVNYDCQLGEVSLVENITSMLTKIAQGKYKKQEYSTMILPVQEAELKIKAIEGLKELVQRLCDFLDQCEQGFQNSGQFDEEEDIYDTQLSRQDTLNNNNTQSDILDNEFDRVEKEKLKKQQIQLAVQKFNLKPKNGVNYLIQNKIIEKDDAKGLSQIFFDYNDIISQEHLGQFLGNVADFNQEVLSEFTDLLDFRDTYIDRAMRIFLTYFQLPGEAQQVDRIMQKFGEKFMNDNAHNTYLKNGGVAYVLSYSLMMLQTSHHNPQVQEKDRITLNAFRSMIKGINEEDGVKDDIDEEESLRIFNEIKKKPLAVHKDQDRNDLMEQALSTNEKQKKDLFLKESFSIVQEGQNKIKKGGQVQYTQVFSLEYLKSLMQEIWSPLFASFTQVYEETDDKGILEICLEGMVYCIKLLGISDMSTQKDTFLFFLTKNSNLLDNSHYINQKNILCIKAILNCALTAGNYLGESWKDVVRCLCQLEYFHLISSKNTSNQVSQKKSRTQKEMMIEHNNSETIAQNIDAGMIDKVFHFSHNLKPDSIKIFIQCLCDLSKDEFKNEDNPRIFYMQRISEVTGFNMKRVKYNWNDIWSNLSKFFTEAGTHINPQIAELSVDFLKQLALKFLEQKELKHFTYQKDFLAPFEQIYINMKINNSQLKEFIIACVYMLTNQAFHNLKSGWKIILRVLNWAIQDNQPNLLQVSFMIIQKIMHEKLDAVLEVMVELVQALTAFAKGQNPQYAVTCIQHTKQCLDFLIKNANKPINEDKQQQQNMQIQEIQQEKYLQQECKKHLEALWIPIMSTLASLFEKDVRGVQKSSMEVLFKILKENGGLFSGEFWKQALRSVLKPLFDEISFCFSKKSFSDEEMYHLTKKNAGVAFEKFYEIIIGFFDQLQPYWQEIIDIFQNCLENQVESLVSLASSSFVKVLEQIGDKLDKDQWERVVCLIEKVQNPEIFDTDKLASLNPEFSQPFEEVMEMIPKKARANFHLNLNKCTRLCITQLMLIKTQQKIFDSFCDKFNDDQLNRWKKLASNLNQKASEFNEMLYLRYSLWKAGFMADMYIVPGLFKHQKDAYSIYLEIVYEQYRRSQSSQDLKVLIREMIQYLQVYSSLISEFMHKNQEEYEKSGKRRKSISTPTKKQAGSQNSLQSPSEESSSQQSKSKKHTFVQSENHSVEDLKQMFLVEYERKIQGMKQVINNYIFPHLNHIQPENLDLEDIQEIVPILIDISSYSFTRSLSYMSCQYCSECDSCGYFTPYSYDGLLREILKNFFSFSLVGMKNVSKNSSYELVKEEEEKDGKQKEQENKIQDKKENQNENEVKQVIQEEVKQSEKNEEIEEQNKKEKEQQLNNNNNGNTEQEQEEQQNQKGGVEEQREKAKEENDQQNEKQGEEIQEQEQELEQQQQQQEEEQEEDEQTEIEQNKEQIEDQDIAQQQQQQPKQKKKKNKNKKK